MIDAPERDSYWRDAGARIGDGVGFAAAIVIIGTDGDAAFACAMGVATAQAARRRVIVGELFGTIAAVREALPDSDPHGLADCFEYGISLARVTHPSRIDPRIDLVAAGTDVADLDAILTDRRWRRIVIRVREAGDLLLIVAPAHAAGTLVLADRFDGAIVLGPDVPAALPVARVIKLIQPPGAIASPIDVVPASMDQVEAEAIAAESPIEVPDEETAPATAPAVPSGPAPTTGRRLAAMALAAALVVIVGWLAWRPLDQTAHLIPKAAPAETLPLVAAGDSSGALRPDAIAADIAGAPVPINPADSATAAAFAVEITAANTQAGAILKLREQGGTLPASTFSPVLVQGATWFRVTTGAFASREAADSLLGRLRASGALDSTAGLVVSAPFAFLVDSGLAPSAVPRVLPSLREQRGLPVYALRQSDGTAWILAGAFETPAQALLYAESLRAAGIAPTLVYRKGRVF